MFKKFFSRVASVWNKVFADGENYQMTKEEIDVMLDIVKILAVNKAVTIC